MAQTIAQRGGDISPIPNQAKEEIGETLGQSMYFNLAQSEEKFKANEKVFLHDSLRSHQIFEAEARNIIETESKKLEEFVKEIETMTAGLDAYEKNVMKEKDAIDMAKTKIGNMKPEIRSLMERKDECAGAIVVKELSNIKFKDFMDYEHDVFKWVLEAIYKEPLSLYKWDNFKRQVFKRDKGVDFLDRIKRTSVKKMKVTDMDFGKRVVERKEQFIKYFERSGKPNNSMRNLLEYISVVVDLKKCFIKIRDEEAFIDEKTAQLHKRKFELEKAKGPVDILNKKIEASKHFIREWETMQAVNAKCVEIIQKRLENV